MAGQQLYCPIQAGQDLGARGTPPPQAVGQQEGTVEAVERHAAAGHDAGTAGDLFQPPGHGEAEDRHRQGQEDPRQARHRGQARLAEAESPPVAGQGLTTRPLESRPRPA